jgi:hypothetical protein
MNYTVPYSEVFYNQFFTTLGQLAAGVVSAALVVPMYEFYAPKFMKYLKEEQLKEKSN